jgi:hypothetical protein
MALMWHAYYFDSLDRKSPVARTAIIEADSEDEAGKIAITQMGRCMRVDVARPMWGAPVARAPASNSAAERLAMLANA